MKSSFRLAAFFAIVNVAFVSATIINIPDDYPTIQQGIDASIDGDTVLVQPGTYYENINFNGHNIVLGSLFLTTGDTSYIEQTIIDGGNNNRVISIAYSDSVLTITGFTITNGRATIGAGIYCLGTYALISNNVIFNNITDLYPGRGGGIYCTNSHVIIRDNIIFNNINDIYSGKGGGIYCITGNYFIYNNVIRNNESYDGGGIYLASCDEGRIEGNHVFDNAASNGAGLYCYNSDIIVSSNIIDGNTNSFKGGGIYCNTYSCPVIEFNILSNNNGSGIYCMSSSDPVIRDNIISGNLGGGIRCRDSSPLIQRNIIFANSTMFKGAGIYCQDHSDPQIQNNTICFNLALEHDFHPNYGLGGGLYLSNDSQPIIANNIFWGDSAENDGNEIYNQGVWLEINYCDIQGGWEGEGNIDADPMFVDPENGDFHLLAGSPCIDAGDPGSPLDPDSTRADIGAFYFDQTVGIDDVVVLPSEYYLRQNYPNPFNLSTTISFDLSERSNVIIDIYDILGRKVTTVLDAYKQGGSHKVIWHADDLPSGMYFYKLRAGEYSESKRMVLIK